MDIYAVKPAPPGEQGLCARPECAAPALAHCGLIVPAVAGPLAVYFCFQDFLRALGLMRDLEMQGEGKQQAWGAVTRLGEAILPAAITMLGGELPARGELWAALSNSARLHEQARERYQDADDGTEEGREKRLEVLRTGAISLRDAFCVEAAAARDETGDRALEGTLYLVSREFLSAGNLIIPTKSVPHPQVLIALLALCAVRSISPVGDEASERVAIEQALAAVREMARGLAPRPDEQLSPVGQELARALASSPAWQVGSKPAGIVPWAITIPPKGDAWQARAREGNLLSAGLERLRQGQAPTPTQSGPVGAYLRAFEEQMEALRRRAREHEIDAEGWQHRYERIALEWNGICKALAELGIELFYRSGWEWTWRGDDVGPAPVSSGQGYGDAAQALQAALRWRIERG
jgi:hypothetical protein